MTALIADLELDDRLVTAPAGLPLFVHRAGKLRRVPFSLRDFLFTDLVPWTGKLRVLLEPLTAGARADERVADYFVRKLGRELYENLAGPLYGGLYASDPADMVVGLSLGHVLAEFGIGRSLVVPLLRRGGRVAPPAACSFVDGLETIPRALHARNRENVRTGVEVRAVGPERRGWTVETSAGTLEAEHVVVTAPAPAAARILEAGGVAAGNLNALTYNPLAVVHLHSVASLRGLGYQVGLGENLVTRGVTFNDSLFERRGVYTAYLGGAKRRDAMEWTDEVLGETAVREFSKVTGADATVLHVAREWMPAWDASWVALQETPRLPGLHFATNWQSRPGIPGRLAQASRLAASLAASLANRTTPDIA